MGSFISLPLLPFHNLSPSVLFANEHGYLCINKRASCLFILPILLEKSALESYEQIRQWRKWPRKVSKNWWEWASPEVRVVKSKGKDHKCDSLTGQQKSGDCSIHKGVLLVLPQIQRIHPQRRLPATSLHDSQVWPCILPNSFHCEKFFLLTSFIIMKS